MTTYAEFLAAKRARVAPTGVSCTPRDMHRFLHGWQAHLVALSARRGRNALWADCGLGKTVMQVEWARTVADRSLIVAPLAVCGQTIGEARHVDQDIAYVRDDSEVGAAGIYITNFEVAHRINPARFGGVVLDESSILKNVAGKMRDRLINLYRDVPYRLACTATPAPNDVAELANHAEWLGVATRREMLSTYFVHDSDMGWRLKGHAADAMWEWMSAWAVALRSPADLGWPDDGYVLPELHIEPHLLAVNVEVDGQLFPTDLGGVGGRARVRRETLGARVARAVDLATSDGEQWIAWCGLNDEADAIAAAIPDAMNVPGSWTPEAKADALRRFAAGEVRVLVTKPSIAGFGLNFQRCSRMVFVGLSDSYEAYYQCIRRCYRYGQQNPVRVHIVLSELEGQIAANIARKERQAHAATDALVRRLRPREEAA